MKSISRRELFRIGAIAGAAAVVAPMPVIGQTSFGGSKEKGPAPIHDSDAVEPVQTVNGKRVAFLQLDLKDNWDKVLAQMGEDTGGSVDITAINTGLRPRRLTIIMEEL